MKLLKIILLIFITISFNACSALVSLDKNLMSVSNALSSPDPVTGKRELVYTSSQKEIKTAKNSTKNIIKTLKKKGIKIDRQTKYHSRIKKVFNRLKKVVHRQELPWEIHTIDKKDWNAFTIGGGKVFIYTGIFKGKVAIKSDDELAAVIAHEMAHNAARHVSEGKAKIMTTRLVDKSLRKDIYNASFITNQEDEADKISVIYMALAGYNPTASVNIWKRMDKYYGSDKGNLLYDHPLNYDRMKNLEYYSSIAKEYYIPKKINPEYKKILEDNRLFSRKKLFPNVKAGKGGGTLALLEVLLNTALEVQKAKDEIEKRKRKK